MRVFILGGTGLVGTRLVRRLRDRGDSVAVLTRRPEVARAKLAPGCVIVEGDPMQPGAWSAAVKDADAVINLVGEPVLGKRWNQSLKALLRNSRVQSTANAVKALALAPLTQAGQPKVLLNASAIGYYGPHANEELTEAAPPGDDELARLTVDWEAAAREAEPLGVRVALLRIGVVLDPDGGALALMLPPFKLGLGGPIGSGRQWLSWIHHRDVVGILLLALDRDEA
ncbi:MAG TPA: TIGR01777 family oxidoreductase, partial [Gemmataceae bacterium]|nr:TIGR01777 family oxidoreductase [Gemmataceae bacterium]